MPCYSTIKRLQINDMDRLEAAIKALGHEYTRDKAGIFDKTADIDFEMAGQSIVASATSKQLTGILRKYAEIGVRKFAKQKGYLVSKTDGKKMILTKLGG